MTDPHKAKRLFLVGALALSALSRAQQGELVWGPMKNQGAVSAKAGAPVVLNYPLSWSGDEEVDVRFSSTGLFRENKQPRVSVVATVPDGVASTNGAVRLEPNQAYTLQLTLGGIVDPGGCTRAR